VPARDQFEASIGISSLQQADAIQQNMTPVLEWIGRRRGPDTEAALSARVRWVLDEFVSGKPPERGPAGNLILSLSPTARELSFALRRWADDIDREEQGSFAQVREPPGGLTELTDVEKAMMIFTRDPNQSLREIARQVPCHHSLLVRDKSFQRLRRAHQGSIPKGKKSREGDTEAEAEESE
jgi:hypothetical protein